MTKKIGKLKLHCSKDAVAFRWGEGKIHRLSLDKFKKDSGSAGDADAGGSYDRDAYESDYQPQSYQAGRYSDVLYSNDWLMYALLVVFPPLGIWILWKRERFTPIVRAVASVLSAIWFIILLIWLFSALLGTGGSDTIATPTPNPNQQAQTVNTDKLLDSSDIDATATPAPTPRASSGSTDAVDLSDDLTADTTDSGTTDASTDSAGTTYCYSASSGTYYHAKADCPDIEAGATKVSLQLARQRQQSSCPTCYDTAGNTTTASFYITSSGKYYHQSKSCSKIAGKSVTAVSQQAAVQGGKEACPTCIGSYWHTKNGKYYHAKEHCSGMSSATRVTKAAATKAGQKPCPVCISGKTAASSATTTAAKYYSTSNGKYYHVKKTCSGMTNAKQITLANAKKKGQKACPVCISAKSTASTGSGGYYATRNGTYYHTKSDCSGMKDATKLTLATAKKAGKKPCPICVAKAVTAAKTTAAKTAASGVTYYYAVANGKYYHKNSTCSGIKNAKKVTKATAVKNGLKACPVCLAAQATKVYATTGGKYYHKTSGCSGIKNARSMTLAKAANQGKTPCPVCYPSASSKATYCYSTSTNKYYHLKKGCSGMINATKMTVATAKKKGKTACPVCAVKTAAQTQYFFVTKNNKYYHNKSNCSGMTGAVKATLNACKTAGKTACPVCVTKTVAKPTPTPNPAKKVYCYASSGSKYYHKQRTCSGLKNAKLVLLSKAKTAGKTACPICVTKTITSRTQTTSYANKNTTCYASGTSAYYHKDANCVSGLKKTTVAAAIKKGKAPCPSCSAGLTTYVYVTKDGLRYHRKATCSGNVNPYKISLSTAVKQNYTRCPKCNAPKAK